MMFYFASSHIHCYFLKPLQPGVAFLYTGLEWVKFEAFKYGLLLEGSTYFRVKKMNHMKFSDFVIAFLKMKIKQDFVSINKKGEYV